MMFLNSSPKSIRSKIIQAAIEVDNEYRRYRHNRAGGSLSTPSMENSD
jgi:hypothetical protein